MWPSITAVLWAQINSVELHNLWKPIQMATATCGQKLRDTKAAMILANVYWSISCHCLPVYRRWIYFRTIVVDRIKISRLSQSFFMQSTVLLILTKYSTRFWKLNILIWHAAFDHAKRYAKVRSISHWEEIWTIARQNNPCNFTGLQYSGFYDLKAVATATISNNSVDNDEQPVNWRKVQALLYQCNSDSSPSNSVAFRYSLQYEYRHIS